MVVFARHITPGVIAENRKTLALVFFFFSFEKKKTRGLKRRWQNPAQGEGRKMIPNSVIRVGDGRGFVVEGSGPRGLGSARYIITGGHCLPKLPPCHGMSYTEERTYLKLLARLGETPSVSCECLFVDPIADIAVLGMPDDQELSAEAEAYEALVEAATPLIVAEPPGKPIADEVAELARHGIDQKAAMHKCPAPYYQSIINGFHAQSAISQMEC